MSNFVDAKSIVHTQPHTYRMRVVPLLFAFALAMSVSASAQAIAHPGDSPLERILGRGLAGGIGMGILIGLVLLLYKSWTAIERMRARRSTPVPSATPNTSPTTNSSGVATMPTAPHIDALYEQALDELEKGQTVKPTWARALAEGDGDDGKARATYIRLRVAQTATQGQATTEARVEASAIAHVSGTKRWAIIATVGVLALSIIAGLASFLTDPTKLTFTKLQSCTDDKCETYTGNISTRLTVDVSKKIVLQEMLDSTGARKVLQNLSEGKTCTFMDSNDWFCKKTEDNMIGGPTFLISHSRDEYRLQDGHFQTVFETYLSDSRGTYNRLKLKSDWTK